jgi:hypothetical protein
MTHPGAIKWFERKKQRRVERAVRAQENEGAAKRRHEVHLARYRQQAAERAELSVKGITISRENALKKRALRLVKPAEGR